MSRRISQDKVIERFIVTHGNKYDYSKVEYSNVDTKIVIICPDHGEFMQSPDKHRTGNGCPRCGDVAVRSILSDSTEDVVRKFKDVHGDRYNYDKVCYKNTDTKVIIGCKDHGEFLQTPYKHKLGQGCPKCANHGFNPLHPAILYYLKVVKDGITAYKIGITNKTVKERYNNTDLANITVLSTWEYEVGADAYNAEQTILELNKKDLYVGTPLLSDGNTELFTRDVGGFDE